MIKVKELAICKKRGHDGLSHEGWRQCKWCGIWHREIRTREEREDTPPEAEIDPFMKLQEHTNVSEQPREQPEKIDLRRTKAGGRKKPRG